MDFKPLPSLDYLKSRLDYEPDTGVFRWKASGHGRNVSQEAGYVMPNGYRFIKIDGALFRAHRLAWLIMTGEEPPLLIDHHDENRDNNRFANLRDASFRQNLTNKGPQARNKLGIKGVYWDDRRKSYKAQIKYKGKTINLKRCKTLEEAVSIRQEAARKLHGEFIHASELAPAPRA